VLLVDDDEGICDFVRMALHDAGFDIATAPNGRAALDLLPSFQPGLILLDMRMPQMDGWQFSREYRATPGPHVPIVVVTAARDAAQSAAEVNADAHLAKPFRVADLIQIVRRFCPQAPDESRSPH
jgi:CheY-like chemotaxis protein